MSLCHVFVCRPDIPDSSEVELVEPFDSGATDADSGAGNPVVIVVKPTSFGDVFAGFPGFGRFPGLGSLPRVGAEIPHPPGVSLEDIFGGGDQELPLLPSNNNCGLICKVTHSPAAGLVMDLVSAISDLTRGSRVEIVNGMRASVGHGRNTRSKGVICVQHLFPTCHIIIIFMM